MVHVKKLVECTACIFVGVLLFAFFAMVLLSGCGAAPAEHDANEEITVIYLYEDIDAVKIPEYLAVRAILGEASGEGYQGMLDVASGIRARGSLVGVYGLKAPHVDGEKKSTWDLARKAWAVSEHTPTHIGDHWGSTKCDKKWLAKMDADKRYTKVHSSGNHVFYKEEGR